MRKIVPVTRCKVGLLGGSFNPPHMGHINISLMSLKKFNLSKVIWLVTPCSPMKIQSSYSSLESRVEKCKTITNPYKNKIKVRDIEKSFRSFYSSNSLEEIKKWHRDIEFYWIIGCDNLLQISKWYKWEKIFTMSRVVVCERTSMALKSHNVKPSHKFKSKHLYNRSPICENDSDFYILHIKKINLSSSEIRSFSCLK